MSNQPSFFAELKRRNVYKVAVAYAVVGWLLIQVATQVFPFLEIPNWAIRLVIVLAALGFPVALIIAWAFEITPEGIKRTDAADAKRQHSRGGVWIAVVAIAATLSVGLFFLGRYTAGRGTPRENVAAAGVQQKSIAVLPLVNTSGDPSNEYFSDGLSEELIAVLAKIPDLKVIGRSSSFLFKGKSDDSKTIGEKLGVAQLIEGSVRKQGERVRIVAELINAADGRSLWSETYDRELKDVFGVQSEIAKAVADQMKVTLLGQTAQAGAGTATENPAAHNAVLQADFYFQQQTGESLRKAVGFLKEAIRLDPNYALAYARLGNTWRALGANFSTTSATKSYDEARTAANKAVALAPDLAEVRMTVGLLAMTPNFDLPGAEKEFRHVLQSSPNSAAAKNALTLCLLGQNRLAEAETTCREAISLDPLQTTLWYNLGRIKIATDQYGDAEEALRKGLELQPGASRFHTLLSTLDILRNRLAEAETQAQQESDGFWRHYAIALVKQLRGDRLAADAALKDFIENDSDGGAFQVAVLYAVRKEPDQMFKWLDTAYETRDSGMIQLAIMPFFRPYFGDPRFTALCQKLNVQVLPGPAKL